MARRAHGALGAPIMALLFVLFPRMGPLWGVPQDGISKTGLSNTMRLGSVAQVANDDSIAMRLRFEGPRPPPPDLYFRGPVLTRFDGVEWRPLGLPFAPAGFAPRTPNLKLGGTPIRYEVTLEPLRLASVPLLEATTEVQPLDGVQLSARDDLQWLAERPLVERIRARGRGAHRASCSARRSGSASCRTAWSCRAATTRARWPGRAPCASSRACAAPSHAVLAEAVLRHIRDRRLQLHAVAGPVRPRRIDEFWLDGKEGFCEHFAASFVVVMRAMGVPARVVTGYQGADLSPVDGYTVVRQSSAHAWAEYWQPGVGWVRADPTAAVAPDRIGRSTRLAPQLGFVAGTLTTMNPRAHGADAQRAGRRSTTAGTSGSCSTRAASSSTC